MLDGIAESAGDRLLACYFVKGLRAPLSRDYLIGHVERFVFCPLLIQLLARTNIGAGYCLSIFQRMIALPSQSTRTTLNATSTSEPDAFGCAE